MFTNAKAQHVDEVIRMAAEARDKDDLAEALLRVEDETGYTIEFIYDIFTEALDDEALTREEAEDPERLLPIWDQVIIPAYEYDY